MKQELDKATYECGHCRVVSVVVDKKWKNVSEVAERLYDVYKCLVCDRELALEREMWEGVVVWGR